ncbi:DUF1496 domain-containing protein [Aeromonas schubertii]|uniref:DUF1496 domain-containing protein n=1 Tax=Aeromonas schubertii TaxID=652 RepID=A0A0S2SKP2_9GAMM|nr:DUF1496 domain-containing protein [Aeromonas schubertii]ALP42295.1 hypothetical protein WL1483_2876 [Aeromonas schubertii]
MMKWHVLGLLSLWGVGAGAAHAEGDARLWLPVNPGERVCWYEDRRYSLGAVLDLESGPLICAPQNEQESNGPLSWHALSAKPEQPKVEKGDKRLQVGA